MKELLTYVAQHLVEHPEQVSVTETDADGEVLLELRVAPEDTGKVIGRQGRIAKEIRTLIRSVAQRSGKRVYHQHQKEGIPREAAISRGG